MQTEIVFTFGCTKKLEPEDCPKEGNRSKCNRCNYYRANGLTYDQAFQICMQRVINSRK